MYEYGVALVLGAWLLVSAVLQVPVERLQRLRRWDLASLIPQWSFFAPNPATEDLHLLYRDRLDSSALTPWTELDVSAGRAWWNAVWNPERRRSKAFFDAATLLLREEAQTGPVCVQASVPYLLLLSFVAGVPRAAACRETQFLLMKSPAKRDPSAFQTLFVSGLHKL